MPISEKIKKLIREFKLYWRYLLIVLAFCFFPIPTNAWLSSFPISADSSIGQDCNDYCTTYSATCTGVSSVSTSTDNLTWMTIESTCLATSSQARYGINPCAYDIAAGIQCGDYQSIWHYCECNGEENIYGEEIYIVNPTEGYEITFPQPAPIIFEYYNRNNNFDTAIIELNYLSVPQFSSELTYSIGSTSTSTIGVVYANLMNGSWQARAWLWNSNTWSVSTSSTYVNFTVSSSTIPSNTWPETGLTDYNLTSATTFSTSTIHDMVCSADEWANGDWWTVISCNIAEMVWRVGGKLSDLAKLTAEKVKLGFAILFPFNVPINIYNAWNDSNNQALPTGLTYISNFIDSSGNLTIHIPNDFETQSSTTPVVIFGESVFREPEGGTLDLFFGFIRSLSTFLIWGAFIFAIWNFGQRVYDDLINIKKEDTL